MARSKGKQELMNGSRSSINIYTDGSCSGNPGPGGWAAIVVQDGRQVELKGSAELTTSNRMELTAAINGLDYVPQGHEVSIYSDSEYLVNTMTRHWKRRANLDLWHRLDELTAARKVKWIWVKGHSGHQQNEMANKLANEMTNEVNHRRLKQVARGSFN